VGEFVGDSDVGLGVGEGVGGFVGRGVGRAVGGGVGGGVVTTISFTNGESSSIEATPISPSQTSAFSSEIQLFQPNGFDSEQQLPVEVSITHKPSEVQELARPLHELLESPSHKTDCEVTMAWRRVSR